MSVYDYEPDGMMVKGEVGWKGMYVMVYTALLDYGIRYGMIRRVF